MKSSFPHMIHKSACHHGWHAEENFTNWLPNSAILSHFWELQQKNTQCTDRHITFMPHGFSTRHYSCIRKAILD